MKTRQEDVNITRSDNIIESSFGISSDDSAHILMILRDKLYSDKIMAVIREYTTNARDAHVDAGKEDTPIEVSIPTMLNPVFSIRDYGLGLSEEEVRNIYVMYGASTKRQSNNVIGQLGLGCKSGFAYTDKFHIVSWHGGEKKLYCAYIDETKKGKIALMHSQPSDEPEGVEIQIPVEKNDFQSFAQKAARSLAFMEPTPKISGGPSIDKPAYKYEFALGNGVKCKLHSSHNRRVIMGSIAYPLEGRELDLDMNSESLLNHGLDLYVNIGDVDIAANRESLEYTKETRECISNYLKMFAPLVVKEISKSIETAKTLREAKVNYNKIDFQLGKIINKRSLLWRGKPVNGYIIDLPWNYDKQKFKIYHVNRYWKRTNYNEVNRVEARDECIFFDVDKETGWKTKITRYMNENIEMFSGNNYIIAITYSTKEERDKLFDKHGIDEYKVIKLSDIKFKPPVRNKSTKPRSVSHIGKIFNLLPPEKRPADEKKQSLKWAKVKKLEEGTKYYVEIYRFEPSFTVGKTSLTAIDTILNILKSFKKDIPYDKIYGVKEGVKMDDSWVSLGDEIEKRIRSCNAAQLIAESQEYSQNVPTETRKLINRIDDVAEGSSALSLLLVAKQLKECDDKIPHLYQAITMLNNFGIPIPKPKVNVEPFVEAARKEYRLTAKTGLFPDCKDLMFSYHYETSTDTKERDDMIVDYINMKQKQRSKQK